MIHNHDIFKIISLHRVSYCTVDPYYDKVFCYISRNQETKKLECHAFLCSKKSKVLCMACIHSFTVDFITAV